MPGATVTDSVSKYRERLERLEAAVTAKMDRWGIPVLRAALGIVFIWFGALKIVGLSPAEPIIAAVIYLVEPSTFIPILGVWEVAIGVCLLYRPLVRLGLVLLFLQLPGTFLPAVLVPGAVFETFPFVLTTEGQYIVKNVVIIGAAIVIGGAVHREMSEESPDSETV